MTRRPSPRTMLAALLVTLLLIPTLPALAQGNPTPTPDGGTGRGAGRTTSIAPSATDEPAIDMEDWITLEGDGVSLMVPPQFEGGSVEDMLEILDSVEGFLGEDFAALIEVARNNPELYKLFAIAPELLRDGVLTNINITGSPLGMALPMETILELLPASFPDVMEIVETEVISVGDYDEVGRIILEMEMMGLSQQIVMYAFLIEEDLYAIAFTTSVDAYKELGPVFEQIAATLVVNDN